MGRKQKFNEKSRVLTMRVPESRYHEIKNIINDYMSNNKTNRYRIQNNNSLEMLKKLYDIMSNLMDIKSDKINEFIQNETIITKIKEMIS